MKDSRLVVPLTLMYTGRLMPSRWRVVARSISGDAACPADMRGNAVAHVRCAECSGSVAQHHGVTVTSSITMEALTASAGRTYRRHCIEFTMQHNPIYHAFTTVKYMLAITVLCHIHEQIGVKQYTQRHTAHAKHMTYSRHSIHTYTTHYQLMADTAYTTHHQLMAVPGEILSGDGGRPHPCR